MMVILGIDVGKDFLDCELLGTQTGNRRVPNTVRGFEQLSAWLRNRKATRVHACMEATGGWSEELAFYLHDRGHVVSIVNPMQIRAFGTCELSRAKTDKADAGLIARFCKAINPAPWDPPTKAQKRLRQLVRRRLSLIDMRTQEVNRLEAPDTQDVRDSIAAIIAALDQQIADLENQIKRTIDEDDDLRGKRDLIESIDGIGPVTASTLLAEAPHLEKFASAKALTAYFGMCPHTRQSGRSLNSSWTTKIGNRSIRRVLYMAALSAQRHNPVLRAFADRLRENGKQRMQIVVAVMRKLLVLIFGVLKTQRPFDPAWA